MEIENLFLLKQKIHSLKEQIDSLTLLKASSVSVSSSANTESSIEKIVEKIDELTIEIEEDTIKYIEEYERLYKEIGEIEDEETKVVAMKRLLENKPYRIIGDEMNIDRTTAYRIIKRWREKNEKRKD